MKTEHWRDVDGFVGLYQVSDWGQVRTGNLRILKQSGSTPVTVMLTDELMKQRRRAVGQLVARAFIGPSPPGSRNGHIYRQDGDPYNNKATNLSWTPGDAASFGHHARRHPAARRNIVSIGRFTGLEQLRVVDAYNNGLTVDLLALRHDTTESRIKGILGVHRDRIKLERTPG